MARAQRVKDPTELSAAEWVRKQLIDDIIAGRLRPGERLCEVRIAARLGCSRTPVREAFRHLGALGFAHFEKNRGGVVARLERAAMFELFEALAELCAAAAGLGALKAEIRRLTFAQKAGEGVAAPAAGGEEIDALAALGDLAGNRSLAQAMGALRCRLLPYWRLSAAVAEGWPVEGAAAQADLAAAIAAGNEETARRAARSFIQMARDRITAALPSQRLG